MSMEQIQLRKASVGDRRRGITGIADTLRRGARMSKPQQRFSLLIAALVIALLAAGMVITGNRAAEIHAVNQQAQVLGDAMGAERVEVDKNSYITLNASYGTREIEGKRVVLLERFTESQNYWLIYGTGEDLEACQAALGKNSDKKIVLLGESGEKSLWITLGKDDDVRKCVDAAQSAVIMPLDDWSDELAEEKGSADYAAMASVMDGMTFIRYQKTAAGFYFTRGTAAAVEDAEHEKNTVRLFRILVIVLMIAAAGALAYTLKSVKFLKRDIREQRKVRLIILAAAAVLLAGMVLLTARIDALSDEIVESRSMLFTFTEVEAEENAEEAAGEAASTFRYLDVRAKGKVKPTLEVTAPAEVSGFSMNRTLSWVLLGLLAAVCFALLYFFRYERDLGFPIFNTCLLVVLMFVTLYPVLNTVAYSFNDGTDALRGGIGILPRKFSTKSYDTVLWANKVDETGTVYEKNPDGTFKLGEDGEKIPVKLLNPDILQAALISASKTIITTVLNLFWTGMLAYTLTRKEYVLRKFITLAMVLTMYVNAGLIPNYLMISKTLNLSGSYLVYIIPTMFSCFNMIVIRTYIAALPGELVESARIDGAGDIRIYWQIIFPLCAPVLATVALFVAVGAWNSWYDTMLYASGNKELHSLQYFLMGKLAGAGQTSNQAAQTVDASSARVAATVTPITVRCAITVITALPILVIYPFLQKYFVTGMALGSVKG